MTHEKKLKKNHILETHVASSMGKKFTVHAQTINICFRLLEKHKKYKQDVYDKKISKEYIQSHLKGAL